MIISIIVAGILFKTNLRFRFWIYMIVYRIKAIIDPVDLDHCKKRYGNKYIYPRSVKYSFDDEDEAFDSGYKWICGLAQYPRSRKQFKALNCSNSSVIDDGVKYYEDFNKGTKSACDNM